LTDGKAKKEEKTMKRVLVGLALAGLCSGAILTHSDVPGVELTVTPLYEVASLVIEGPPNAMQLILDLGVGYHLHASCPGRVDPGATCAEDYANQHGGDWTTMLHSVFAYYEWIGPMIVPGEGHLQVADITYDMPLAYTSPDGFPGKSISSVATFSVPRIIERGVPFTSVITLQLNGTMAIDDADFGGSRNVAANVIAAPEPGTLWTLGLSTLMIIGLKRRQLQTAPAKS
jgi:hypothetical protein